MYKPSTADSTGDRIEQLEQSEVW